jgi:hypothetical protein
MSPKPKEEESTVEEHKVVAQGGKGNWRSAALLHGSFH